MHRRGVLALLTLAVALAGCSKPYRPPSLVLIVVDTLRADALGCYGDPDAATPALDALASSGVLFRRCVSQAPWTLPAVGTILTVGPVLPRHALNPLLTLRACRTLFTLRPGDRRCILARLIALLRGLIRRERRGKPERVQQAGAGDVLTVHLDVHQHQGECHTSRYRCRS